MKPRKVFIDEHTKEAAIDYANTEGEIRGFKVGSTAWKNAFKSFLAESLASMSIGRDGSAKNPRGGHKYKIKTDLYPEIFQKFASKAAEGYVGSSGSRGMPIENAQDRILSAVTNLVKLFENGILGVKNTTIGTKTGKISSRDMSQVQIPNREDFSSDKEFNDYVGMVIYNWLMRDLVTHAVLQSLMPFFTMTKSDVIDIMKKAPGFEINDLKEFSDEREQFIRYLQGK